MVRSLLTVALAATLASAGIVVEKGVAQQKASPDVISKNVLSLKRTTIPSKSSAALRKWGWGRHHHHSHHYGTTHLNNSQDVEYTTTIKFDKTPVDVIVDTGSSDTWIVQQGFQCVNNNSMPQPEAACNFGTPFPGTFQLGEIPDVNFNIEYGDLEFATGPMGYEDVHVAGLVAHKQTVALVNYTYFSGDGYTAGLMGIAYPALTSKYPGTNASADNFNQSIEYDPIITTLIKEHKMAPVFSLALERNSAAGYLALGGLPPVRPDGPFTSTPILITHEQYENPRSEVQRSFYTVQVQNFYTGTGHTLEPVAGGAGAYAILDSGTTLAYVPNEVADEIYKLYDPPAAYDPNFGGYSVACNATAPNFAVELGGTIFHVSPKDLIYDYPSTEDPQEGKCLVGVTGGGPLASGALYILGDTFLNNVIAVFDIGASEIRLAPHHY